MGSYLARSIAPSGIPRGRMGTGDAKKPVERRRGTGTRPAFRSSSEILSDGRTEVNQELAIRGGSARVGGLGSGRGGRGRPTEIEPCGGGHGVRGRNRRRTSSRTSDRGVGSERAANDLGHRHPLGSWRTRPLGTGTGRWPRRSLPPPRMVPTLRQATRRATRWQGRSRPFSAAGGNSPVLQHGESVKRRPRSPSQTRRKRRA